MKTTSRSGAGRGGFTLVELLVVLTIMAILIGILLPAVKKAREEGRAVVCATQLNQLFVASFAYTEAHDDFLPYTGWKDGAGAMYREWWPTQISRFMGTQLDIFSCPSDFRPHSNISVYFREGAMFLSRGESGSFQLDMSYRGSCDSLDEMPGSSSQLVTRRITDWDRPADGLYLCEAEAQNDTDDKYTQRECFRWSNLQSVRGFRTNSDWTRHSGTVNIVFLDGHVDTAYPYEVVEIALAQEFTLN